MERHHVFFGMSNRKRSEEYGMVTMLCAEHHREGKEAVHKNREKDLELKRAFQEIFEEENPEVDFRTVFGKSYR